MKWNIASEIPISLSEIIFRECWSKGARERGWMKMVRIRGKSSSRDNLPWPRNRFGGGEVETRKIDTREPKIYSVSLGNTLLFPVAVSTLDAIKGRIIQFVHETATMFLDWKESQIRRRRCCFSSFIFPSFYMSLYFPSFHSNFPKLESRKIISECIWIFNFPRC